MLKRSKFVVFSLGTLSSTSTFYLQYITAAPVFSVLLTTGPLYRYIYYNHIRISENSSRSSAPFARDLMTFVAVLSFAVNHLNNSQEAAGAWWTSFINRYAYDSTSTRVPLTYPRSSLPRTVIVSARAFRPDYDFLQFVLVFMSQRFWFLLLNFYCMQPPLQQLQSIPGIYTAVNNINYYSNTTAASTVWYRAVLQYDYHCYYHTLLHRAQLIYFKV